jgi:hypothetical protein
MDPNGNWVYNAPDVTVNGQTGNSSVVWSGLSPQDWASLFDSGAGVGNAGGAAAGYQPTSAGSMYMGSQAGYGGVFGNMGQDWENLFSDQSGSAGASIYGQDNQTVYNPATDQSQYNYGIPDYYGTSSDTSGGDDYYGDGG